MPPFIYNLADVKKSADRKLFKVVSMFAGGGGSSTGYRLAGAEILAINEFIPEAQDAYQKNYPDTYIFREDIRKLTGEMILAQIGMKKGELDILDGSPPCSSFSMAGIREKGWGKEKKYSTSKQRTDDLFYEFARILKEIQPKVFICENVKGITVGAAADLLGSGQRDFFGNSPDTIFDTLKACGYKVKYKVLNSKFFGVPQSRDRTIFIGVREDIKIEATYPKNNKNLVTLKEAFTGINNEGEELKFAKGDAVDLLKQCAPGQSLADFHPKGNYFTWVRINQESQSPALIANPSLFHDTEMRLLSIPECIRVQSFPDDYYLGEKFNHKWERLGRSVPPLMMKAIAEHVYNTILK